MPTDAEGLRKAVSLAIWKAEQSGSPKDWAEVSALEAELAGALPADSPESRIALRGAAAARLKADELTGQGEVCGETYDHDIDHAEYCEEDGRTYWHCRRCDAEGFDEPEAPHAD